MSLPVGIHMRIVRRTKSQKDADKHDNDLGEGSFYQAYVEGTHTTITISS